MIGALGGAECRTPGVALSEYENARGTGNIHIWFEGDVPHERSRRAAPRAAARGGGRQCLLGHGRRARRDRLDDGRTLPVDDLPHLPPCAPTKIICPHLTYRSRGIESRNEEQPTPTPTYFMKPITALNQHGGEVTRPDDCKYLNYEGEFAAVIGSVTRNVTPEEAWSHIAGFVPVLDMGVHDFRDTDAGFDAAVKGRRRPVPGRARDRCGCRSARAAPAYLSQR